MKILITGGTGFLGRRLVSRLVSDGHEVVCLSRTPRIPWLPPGARLVEGTLARVSDWIEDVGNCDVLIHAAAAMSGGAPILFLNNVVATRELIAAAQRLDVKRFVLISSLGVYGSGQLRPGDTLDETCEVDPKPHLRDPYSYSKIAQEQVAWEAFQQSKLPLVVIRPGVIYGPGRGCLSSRIGLQIGRSLIKIGGRRKVPYTYVDNCADAIALATTAPDVVGHAINVIDDDLPTARWVFKQNQRYGKSIRAVIPIPRWAVGPLSALNVRYSRWSEGMIPAVLTPYKSSAMWKRLEYKNEKAKRMLGWRPRVTFTEGVRLASQDPA